MDELIKNAREHLNKSLEKFIGRKIDATTEIQIKERIKTVILGTINQGFVVIPTPSKIQTPDTSKYNPRIFIGLSNSTIKLIPGDPYSRKIFGFPEPQYEHDCERCLFLGRMEDQDWYVCGGFSGDLTYIIRYSSAAEHYSSDTNPITDSPIYRVKEHFDSLGINPKDLIGGNHEG